MQKVLYRESTTIQAITTRLSYKMDNLFLKCGFVLKNGIEPNRLNQNQAMFKQMLSDYLQFSCDNPQITKELMEELAKYIENEDKFFFALQKTTDDSGQRSQDSLFELLLGINSIQTSVANLLLDKLVELAETDESITWQGDNFNFTHVILKQFCSLDKLENSEELCSRMLQILQTVAITAQQGIIRCLSEIFPDNCHPTITKSLCAFLNSYSPSSICALGALSSFNISVEVLTEIENSATFARALVSVEHLPVVIRFIFNTCIERNAKVISVLRKNLSSIVFTKNTQQAKGISFEEQTKVVSIMDQIKFFIQNKQTVAETWIEVIRDNVDPETEVIDLFIILIIRSDPSKKLAADVLVRNQLQSGLFGEKSLTLIFQIYHWAIKDYTDVIMKLAIKFCNHSGEMFSKFGMNLYRNMYDMGVKQAVIENLINHIIVNPNSTEIDCAIELLTELIEKDSEQIASFRRQIARLLDCLGCLNLYQVRSIYSCLNVLACNGGQEGEFLQHDLQMVTQTQLTQSYLRFKQIGIIGSLMSIKYLASTKDDDSNSEHSKNALFLFELLNASVQYEEITLAMFYDIVSSLLLKEELNPSILKWIKDNVRKRFLCKYIVDRKVCEQENLLFGLDDNGAGETVLNLYPLVAKDRIRNRRRPCWTKIPKIVSPLVLHPEFRLLQLGQSVHNEELKEIKGLLVCPILLFPMEKLNNFTNLKMDEKDVIFCTLFYTLNWFRELINAFSCQFDVDIRRNVVSRLKHIIFLENVLQKCLESTECFQPPQAYFEGDDYNMALSFDSRKRAIALCKYARYFRELDFDVFNLLKENVILSNLTAVSQLDNNFLTPPELIFLLEDLKSKLEFRLQSTSERLPFCHERYKKKYYCFKNLSLMELIQVVERTVSLIPHLCFHLESADEYFRMVNATRTMDNAEFYSESWFMIATCAKLILETLALLFSWKEFDQHQTLLRIGIYYLANRLPSSGKTQLNTVNQALDYGMKFTESATDFSCAVAGLSLGQKLLAFNKTDANRNRLSALADDFLKREWFDKDGLSEHGPKYNRTLQKLLELTLELNADPHKLLRVLLNVALSELSGSQIQSKTYRTMTKSSFSFYYGVIYAHVVKEAKEIANDKSDNTTVLLRWNFVVRMFRSLVNIVRLFMNQNNVITCIVNSRTFVDVFLKSGIPVVASTLRNHTGDVMKLLSILHNSTGFLENIRHQSKVISHRAIIEHVPHLKKALKMLIIRVREVLASHRCQETVWLENLMGKSTIKESIEIDNVKNETDEEDVEDRCEHRLYSSDIDSEKDDIPDEFESDVQTT